MDAGAEDAPCEVEAAFSETDGHANPTWRLGAFLQRSPHGAEGLTVADGSRCVAYLVGREPFQGAQSDGALVVGDEVPAA